MNCITEQDPKLKVAEMQSYIVKLKYVHRSTIFIRVITSFDRNIMRD